MPCEKFQAEDYSFYVLGNLPDAEREEIRAHLETGCAVCASGVQNAEEILQTVGLTAPAVNPPRALRRRVVESVREPRPALFGWTWPRALVTAAVAAGAALVAWNVAPVAEVDSLRAQLARAEGEAQAGRAKTARLESELAAAAGPGADAARKQLASLSERSRELERQVEAYKGLLAAERSRLQGNLQVAGLLAAPDLTLVRLRGPEKGSSAEGHALLTAGSEVLFYASELPALPSGRTYQLWLIRARNPALVSAGTFNPDASNRGTLRFADAALTSGVTAIAVTDEPAGGSEKPTGNKLLVGQTSAPA